MRRSFAMKVVVAAVVLAIFATLLVSLSSEVDMRAHPKEVRGRVVTRSGDPISARVFLATTAPDWLHHLRKAETDPSGAFVFDGVEPGTFEIRATAPGYATRTIEIEKDADAMLEIDVVMDRGLSIQGTVLDGDGKPAAGRQIFVEPRVTEGTGEIWDRFVNGELTSDENGAFEIVGLDAGRYALSLAGDGMKVSEEIVVNAGDRNVVLRALPIGEIAGRVAFVDRDPPSSFTVRIADRVLETLLGAPGTFPSAHR